MKFKMSLLAILVISIFAVDASSASANATTKTERNRQQCYATVERGSRLNVRARPSINARIVGKIANGEAVAVRDYADGGWRYIIYRVGRRRIAGWVAEEYLSC